MNVQQFGVTGLSLGHAHPALSHTAPITLSAKAGGPASLGAVLPLGVCSTTAACGPAAADGSLGCSHHTNSGGSCFPAPLWLQPHHQPLLLASTQQGLSHGGVFCHYSLFHLLGASICQQHSCLWSSPSGAPLSLCPAVLLGFILPRSLLSLTRVSPSFT